MYIIKPYHRKRAKEIGVQIKPSTRGNFKLDVYKNGRLLASIGDRRYADYILHMEEHGKAYADERRKAYYSRHKNDKSVRGLLAKYLLWT
jgi:hypothetical protein